MIAQAWRQQLDQDSRGVGSYASGFRAERQRCGKLQPVDRRQKLRQWPMQQTCQLLRDSAHEVGLVGAGVYCQIGRAEGTAAGAIQMATDMAELEKRRPHGGHQVLSVHESIGSLSDALVVGGG